MTADNSSPGESGVESANNMDMEVVLPRVRLYSPIHKGPFFVFIRAGQNGLCHLKVTKYLFANYKETITRVIQVNKHKLQVLFKSAEAANALPLDDNEVLKSHRVYIPAEHVEVDGLVFLSPEDCLDDLLADGIGKFDGLGLPDVAVIDVFRFQTQLKDSLEKPITKSPTSLVRVTFCGTVLPNKLVINGLMLPVKPYQRQVMFCEHCSRTGHTAKYCVVKARCMKCGENHETKNCATNSADMKCILCGLNHDTNNRKKCPKILAANSKFQSAALKRIKNSYAEAVVLGVPNQYEILSTAEDEEEESGNGALTSNIERKRRKVSKNINKQHNVPSSIQIKSKTVQPNTSQRSSSSVVTREHTPKHKPKPPTPPKETTSLETIARFLKPIVINVVSKIELSSDFKNLLIKAVDYFFDNIFPFCIPFVETLLCNLMPQASNNL